MIKHCPQLRDKLKNIKALYRVYCLEFEQAKNTKEYEQVLGIEAQITKIILELRIKVDLDDLSQEYITEIERKNKANIPLTEVELRFLYDLDYTFHDYINGRDPKIKKLRDTRVDIKADLALLITCSKEQISITPEEALSGNIKFHYGDLDLMRLTSATALKLPDRIHGNLCLNYLKSATALKLPDSIDGSLFLFNLKSAIDLKLPDSIRGTLGLDSLHWKERAELQKKYPNLNIE